MVGVGLLGGVKKSGTLEGFAVVGAMLGFPGRTVGLAVVGAADVGGSVVG